MQQTAWCLAGGELGTGAPCLVLGLAGLACHRPDPAWMRFRLGRGD